MNTKRVIRKVSKNKLVLQSKPVWPYLMPWKRALEIAKALAEPAGNFRATAQDAEHVIFGTADRREEWLKAYSHEHAAMMIASVLGNHGYFAFRFGNMWVEYCKWRVDHAQG